jgi:hypothetical protein
MAIAEATDNVILQAWGLLPKLRALSFIATPGPESQTGWRGHGVAEITAEPAGAAWRLTEHGRFTPDNTAQPVNIHNVYRWQRRPSVLALWHERFGADAAVFLVELVPAGPRRLVSRTGHLCGRDTYTASLALCPGGFTLAWRIRGPAKDERLCYCYTMGERKTVASHDPYTRNF